MSNTRVVALEARCNLQLAAIGQLHQEGERRHVAPHLLGVGELGEQLSDLGYIRPGEYLDNLPLKRPVEHCRIVVVGELKPLDRC